MLMFRGFKMLESTHGLLWLKMIIVLTGGIIFYRKLFYRLSIKHTHRILGMKEANPCLFSFFNIRSYVMMGLMISMGITLRKTGWVAPGYLSFLYLTMSVPLILSSLRFYYTGFYYKRFVVAVVHDKE